MEHRPLDLTIISAKDVKDVNFFSKMSAYAVAAMSNDPLSVQRSPADKEGGTSPTWNFAMRFYLPAAHAEGLLLHIQIKSRSSFGDRLVGEVHIPVKELLDASSSADAMFVSYQLRRPSGKPKGLINISYKVGEKVAPPPTPAKPVTSFLTAASSVPIAYPPQPAAYPPPPPATVVPYPPQPAYGYGAPVPQPAYGYGYPQQQQPPRSNNNFGMGLGAGLIGGALGGLMIENMVDNAYDAGFDDGADF